MRTLIRLIRNISMVRRAAWHLKYKHMPDAVEVETDARCNRRCFYCPVSQAPRRSGRMSEDLFRKIVGDLQEMGFSGRLSYHFYNEPLLDKRLPSFIAHSRDELPRARLVLFTNGDLFTEVTARELFSAGLDRIRVSVHDEATETACRRLIQTLPPDIARKVQLDNTYKGEMPMYNRGGLIFLDKPLFTLYDYSKGCYWASCVVIDYTGKVVLCCNDFHAANAQGDLTKESVTDVWRRSAKLRKDIFLGRYALDICKKCTAPSAART